MDIKTKLAIEYKTASQHRRDKIINEMYNLLKGLIVQLFYNNMGYRLSKKELRDAEQEVKIGIYNALESYKREIHVWEIMLDGTRQNIKKSIEFGTIVYYYIKKAKYKYCAQNAFLAFEIQNKKTDGSGLYKYIYKRYYTDDVTMYGKSANNCKSYKPVPKELQLKPAEYGSELLKYAKKVLPFKQYKILQGLYEFTAATGELEGAQTYIASNSKQLLGAQVGRERVRQIKELVFATLRKAIPQDIANGTYVL